MVDREHVRRLVERELHRRLSASSISSNVSHPALAELSVSLPQAVDSECEQSPPNGPNRPCVIEPSAPCYNSGYCKKLGH